MQMNKLFLIFICIVPTTLIQTFVYDPPIRNSCKIRAGAFIPQSSLMRNIYSTAHIIGEIEVARRVNCHCELWGNFDWFSHKGHSIGLCNSTHIKIANFSLGIKFPFCITPCTEFYFGVGPSIAGVWLRNISSCGCEYITQAAGGIVAKSGFNIALTHKIFLDLFADYLYQPVNFQQRVNVGGLKIGVGLGIRF